MVHTPVQQVAGAVAVDGGNLKGVPQAQTVELINVRIHSAHRVAFVHSQGHRLPGPLQNGKTVNSGFSR